LSLIPKNSSVPARADDLDFTRRKPTSWPSYHSLTMNKKSEGCAAKRTYDIRVRNAFARSGDAGLFPEIEIPRSMALEWIRLGIKEVITHPSFEWSHDTLVEQIASLERSLEAEKAKNRLVKCFLPDQSTCTKLSPTKITSK
jgi:hypothetical protein